MVNETEKQPKIMTKPLPEILDELENYIKQVEEAVRVSQQAAEESRAAASEAKAAGQEAAAAAQKAAEAAVAQVEKDLMNEIKKLRADLSVVSDTATRALALAQAMNLGIAAGSKAYNQEIEKL